MGARARADEILTMREKAKLMKEVGKSKGKGKRQKNDRCYTIKLLEIETKELMVVRLV